MVGAGKMPKRLGIMGGTFDPVHLAHLRAAEEALDLLGLDTVLFIPAAVPPHKPGKKISPFEHRWRMLELALADNPRFRLSDLECRMPGKSYTVNSLRKLTEEFPGAELFFLVGLDAFFEMNTWYRFGELFGLARMVVLGRPGCGAEDVFEFLSGKVSHLYSRGIGTGEFSHPELHSVYALENTRIDISSTRVRQLAASGRSIRYLVPDAVLDYIVKNRPYTQTA